MSENIIFCYSATGNSLAAAKAISADLGGLTVKMITEEFISAQPKVEADFCVIVFPSYAYGLPVGVRRFLKTASFSVKYLALIVTYGTRYGGTLAEGVRLLKRRKQPTHFCTGIKAVENYVNVFGLAKEPKLIKRLERQKQETAATVIALSERRSNKVFTFRPFSALVSTLFRAVKPMFAATYKVTPACNACGLCKRLCPSAAITIADKKGRMRPVFKAKKCDHCQACLQLCPQKAIRFVRITPKSRRYRHPDVSLNELTKRP